MSHEVVLRGSVVVSRRTSEGVIPRPVCHSWQEMIIVPSESGNPGNSGPITTRPRRSAGWRRKKRTKKRLSSEETVRRRRTNCHRQSAWPTKWITDRLRPIFVAIFCGLPSQPTSLIDWCLNPNRYLESDNMNTESAAARGSVWKASPTICRPCLPRHGAR